MFQICNYFKKNKITLINILSLIFVSIVFLLSANNSLDPDFGWHLKMGELISLNGIPKIDPFSYSMPSFPFIDHEWLTNLLIYKLYGLVGYLGLSVIYSFLAFLAIFLSINNLPEKFKLKDCLFASGLLILSSAVIVPFFGVRPQIISWVFLALLIKIIVGSGWKKWSVFLPVLFLFWTNLHGSFFLGIATLIFLISLNFFVERKFNLRDFLVVIFSIGVTFINPYQERIWGEVWMQLSDSALRYRIAEWNPIIFTINFPFFAIFALSLLMVFKYRYKYLFREIALYFVFLIGAITTLRNVPLWIVVSIPIVLFGFYFLREQIRKIKGADLRLVKVSYFFFLGAVCMFLFQSIIYIVPSMFYQRESGYPKEAVAFLKSKLPEGEVFSSYNWGGYLIWKFSEKKVFIDGRMPSWRWDKVSSKETSNAMNDYENVLNGKLSFLEISTKYNIDTVLWSIPKNPNMLTYVLSGLEQLFRKKNNFIFFDYLKDNGWEQIYKDDTSIIFKKIDTKFPKKINSPLASDILTPHGSN